jgi:LmbE family N-acetylglucosaminyl deacetylase
MSVILAVHAHPDDIEIFAGGTLTLLAQRGHSISIVTMTPGDCGTAECSPEQISAIRQREAANSAALVGAAYACAGFRDLAVFNDDRSRRTVVEVLRRFAPDLLLTASPVDYLTDHEVTGLLVRDACFAAPARNYATGATNPAAPLPAIPTLYFVDPLGGCDREGARIIPDFVVDVTGVFEQKKAMLAKHESQRNWLLKHHGMDDYMEMMEAQTRATGALAGVPLGEGFRQYRGHPYPQAPLLQRLLGGFVHELRTHGAVAPP